MNDNKEVMAMLQQISSKLDIVDSKVDEIQREAVKAGAKAGDEQEDRSGEDQPVVRGTALVVDQTVQDIA